MLHFITKIVKFEGFKATNYHFITENELLIELENKVKIKGGGKSESRLNANVSRKRETEGYRRVLLNWHFC